MREAVIAFVLAVGRWAVHELVRGSAESEVAGVAFDEETLGGVFVSEEAGWVQHGGFEPVKCEVVRGPYYPRFEEGAIAFC